MRTRKWQKQHNSNEAGTSVPAFFVIHTMKHKLKCKLLIGFAPDKNPIIITKTSDFDSLDDIRKWILTNMLPQSIWWISYQILCDDVLIEEQRNPNLDEDLRSR